MDKNTVESRVEVQWVAFRAEVEKVLGATGSPYLAMLDKLRDDDGDCLGFKWAPAAKGNHHARPGGLVEHLREMWDIWVKWRKCLPRLSGVDMLDDVFVMKAILLHDLEKADHCFRLVTLDPWVVEYSANWRKQLMPTDDVCSLDIALSNGIVPEPVLLNALMLSHGGFSPVQSKACSVLAKLVYLLDEMSGNVLDQIKTGNLCGWKGSVAERWGTSDCAKAWGVTPR